MFKGNQDRFGPDVADVLTEAKGKSTSKGEVLYKWRGEVPLDCMTNVHPETQRRLTSLRNVMKKGGLQGCEDQVATTYAKKDHWGHGRWGPLYQ